MLRPGSIRLFALLGVLCALRPVAVAGADLVGFWTFEEGAGLTTADQSGQGFTGTLLNGPLWVAGQAGNFALDFDGVDDRVDIGNPPALQITGALTLAAWVRVDSITGNGRIVTKGGASGQRGWSLNVENFNAWAFQIAANSATSVSVNATNIALNQWIHVAGVYDTAARAMRLYTNGMLAAERTDAGVPASQFNSPLNVAIGARPNNQTFFDGRIDDVRVFNRALTAAEVAALLDIVPAPPSFLTEPASQTVVEPQPVTFTAAVRGSAPLSFQWFSNNVAIAGATSIAYTISVTATNMSGSRFAVRVTNTLGSATSSHAFLTVIAPPPQVNDTQFSVDRGFFLAPFQVEIFTETPGATIRYTLDGSSPATNRGAIYTGPITVTNTTVLRAIAYKEGFAPSDVDTQTYIFLEGVLRQANSPPGYPATWVDSSGATVFGADYEMDPDIRNHSQYGGQLSNSLVALPTLSLVMDRNDLFGANGVYVNGGSDENASWERPASVELIYPDGRAGFQIDCGLRPHTHVQRKRSFKLMFKAEYGVDKLRYPIFDDAPWHGDSAADEFDRLILRAGSNDSWQSGSFQGNSARYATYTRDQMVRDSQLAAAGFGARGIYVHLYINGLYWGLYNCTERPDNWFAAEYFGGDETDWYSVNHGGTVEGDATRFNAMHSFAAANNLALLNNWNVLTQSLDVTAFVDYMIVQNYSGTGDWPNNNWYAANRNNPPGPALFFTWDAEDSWVRFVYDNGTTLRSSAGPWIHPGLLNSSLVQDFHRNSQIARFWRSLTNSAEFRLAWADRTYRHCFHGGAFIETNLYARWDALNAAIELPIVAESARWGDVLNGAGVPANPFTPQHWTVARDTLRSNMVNAVGRWIAVCRTYNLYPPNDPPQFNQHGGSVPVGFNLVMSGGAGTILYTLGTDPRLPGGTVSPRAITFEQAVVITSNVTVKARLHSSGIWSALAEASFFPPQDFSKLVVNEICYNPPGLGGIDGDEFEFFELKNIGTNTLDLTGLRLSEGIDYAFPAGTRLVPGEFAVLVRNTNQFALKYPGVRWSGIYGGRLANEGERVTISNVFGARVLSIQYDDRVPWPVTADGYGFSLVPLDPVRLPSSDQGQNWRSSANAGGSPGADDPEPSIPRVMINEVLAASVPPDVDRIELWNSTAQPADISGWLLTDDAAAPRKFRIPDVTVLPTGGFLVFSEADFNSVAGASNSFALSSGGDDVYLFSADAAGVFTSHAHGFIFGASAPGVSLGRHITSTGEEHFPAQATNTFGAPNSAPLVGPVVLNEIHYHPAAGSDEFIELRNITGGPVPLFDPARPTNAWRLNGLGYTFPNNLTLGPRSLLLLVATNPASFKTKYNVPGEVIVVGPYGGVLQDSGESLELQRPGVPATNGVVPWITVDAVRYNDRAPWPVEPDGLGPALERLAAAAYGNDSVNWRASTATNGTPGHVPDIPIEPVIAVDQTDIRATVFAGENAAPIVFQVWNQGASNLLFTIVNTNSFLDVTPGDGSSTGPATPSRQTVHFTSSTLATGAYTGNLSVQDAASGALGGPVRIAVTLTVLPPPTPEIGVSTETIQITVSEGHETPDQSLLIWNDGVGTLEYSLQTDAVWLHADPTAGNLLNIEPPRLHTVQVQTAALSAGLHAASIAINAPGASPSRRVIAVAVEVRPAPLFTAYNDFAWRAGQLSTRITTHTTADGGGGGNGGGPMVDYATGQAVGVMLTITGGAWFGDWQADLGQLSLPGTDAYNVFNGRVDCQGFLSYAAMELALSLSGLDAQVRYEVALFGNRDNVAFSNRLTTVTLAGAQSFANASTPGTIISAPDGATTTAAAGDNTGGGQVIRYTDIVCATDGTFRLSIPAATAADPTRYYLNALMLRAERQAVVSQLGLRFTSNGVLVLQWAGAGFTLEEAPTPNGPWTASANQSNPQVVSSNAGSATFYRLKR